MWETVGLFTIHTPRPLSDQAPWGVCPYRAVTCHLAFDNDGCRRPTTRRTSPEQKARGQSISSPLGRPQNEHDQYRSWAAAREVSKDRTKRLLHAGILVRPPAQMLGAGHTHTHANAVGPWCCRSSTAAARNITRLTGLCDDRAGNLMLEKRRFTYPVNTNG